MRRVNCPDCGILVEQVPWADGKSPVTHELKWFLAKWAKMMSWKEVALSPLGSMKFNGTEVINTRLLFIKSTKVVSDFSGSDQTGPPKLCFGSSEPWRPPPARIYPQILLTRQLKRGTREPSGINPKIRV